MIKNIPNKYSKETLLEVINRNLMGKFDLLYLPRDKKLTKNFGYAFINLTEHMHIIYFYHLFQGKLWPNTVSQKKCELTYAKIQGKTNFLKHYPQENVCNNEDLLKTEERNNEIIIPKVKMVFHFFLGIRNYFFHGCPG